MAITVTHAAIVILCLVSFTNLAQAQNSPRDFLQPHNAARAEVGVGKLSWDSVLKHSRGPYGENIYWGSAGRRWTAADTVARWVPESTYYDCGSNTCAPGRLCGHYTQVTWARTMRLGCGGTVTCDSGGMFVVCSYDPPGNVNWRGPYPGCGD